MTAIVTRGNAADLHLPDETVDLIVTSPPYFGLRSYQDGGEHYSGQVGDEATPTEYLDALIACTAEWMRVLKSGGSIFCNLGDKYAGAPSGPRSGMPGGATRKAEAHVFQTRTRREVGVPTKSLIGLPWRYAIRCIDELGLILRAEIVWAKPNGLPESVTDRVRRSHEQVFHFVKQPRYYSAVDEVRETVLHPTWSRPNRNDMAIADARGVSETSALRNVYTPNPLGKLPGSVWTIPTAPLKVPDHLGVDHFAAYPPELVRRIVLGWSPRDVCTACGEGRRPVVASVGLDMNRPQARRAQELADRAGLTEDHLQALLSVGVSDTGRGKATQNGTGKNRPEVYALADEARSALGGYSREYLLRRPTGFRPTCACPDTTAPSTPGVCLDPFGGTGTTALVASAHGRVGISVDLSADYCRLAQWRTTDPGERARVLKVDKPPMQVDGQLGMFEGLGA